MRLTAPGIIAPLIVGPVLIVLGTAMIAGAREVVTRGWGYVNIDGEFVYVTWDASQLAAGIVLALVGTALVTASLTYLILTRKRKRV